MFYTRSSRGRSSSPTHPPPPSPSLPPLPTTPDRRPIGNWPENSLPVVTPPDWAALAVQNSDSPPQVTDPAGQDNAHAHGTAQARENSAASANDDSAATASDKTDVNGAETDGFDVNLEVFSG